LKIRSAKGDYFAGGEKQGRCLRYHGYFRANAAIVRLPASWCRCPGQYLRI